MKIKNFLIMIYEMVEIFTVTNLEFNDLK